MEEPTHKRTAIFFDGQNLFKSAKEAYGYTYPNYSPMRLAHCICTTKGWDLSEVYFYTGLPIRDRDPVWNQFWSAKLLKMSRRGIHTFSRKLRYSKKEIKLGHGNSFTTEVSEEKGIDVRIAIDVIRKAHKQEYDVAVIVSQDQDLSEVAREIRDIATEQNRWIKIASAFVDGTSNQRGIQGTDWIKIDRDTYDSCIDPECYFPKKRK